MRRIRRILALLAFVSLVIFLALLLNFTAPNPTGRRYSSQMPLTTGQGRNEDIGGDAERILAVDLRLPNNNDSDQRQCICGASAAAPPRECRSCVVSLPSVQTFRRPDFVAPGFIAESKNRLSLPIGDRELGEQLEDYASAARALGRPLWLYVRVDSEVDPDYISLVEATGGGLVRYFTVPGYVDPVDEAARKGLIGSGAVLAVLSLPEIAALLKLRQPATGPRSAHQTARKAAHHVEVLETFTDQRKAALRHQLHDEDTQEQPPSDGEGFD
jgi:hypothetical protein